MYDKRGVLSQTKSYTGISDIFGSTPFNNILYRNPHKSNKEQSVTGDTVAGSKKKTILKECSLQNGHVYVTCERYHGLNKNLSCKSIVHSTSTIFCDLDNICKRHSFHCLAEVNMSNANILKVMKLPINSHGFKGKSNVIVQECATQIHPTLMLSKDSIAINTKRAKKNYPQNNVLSSEIFLRDGKYGKYGKHGNKKQYYNIDFTNNHQKFWSYAKYRTEYTKPIPEEKKNKKKERGKRTEDPCPCQLFSYTCPCTDEKSLCKLSKTSKFLTVADQTTSTNNVTSERKKRQTHDSVRDDKLTNTNDYVNTTIINAQDEPIIEIADKKDIPVLADLSIKCSPQDRRTAPKKSHKVICPNCKERVEVLSSTEEESLKINNSSMYRSKELTSTYNCSTSLKDNLYTFDDGDVCNHEPRCELVPVCQILPIEDIFSNTKNCKKRTIKSSPRVIRITKACRHHPPCTVVPSCQRANVLRNHCEYIPPCLHRPRCINLPLCVPFSKSLHYDEPTEHIEENIQENTEYFQTSRCKYIPEYQQDSLTNVGHHYNIVTHVQNAYEYPKSSAMPSMSPGQTLRSPHSSCRSNKSCQIQCSECNCVYSSHTAKGIGSVDAIVFIRDVGCQFKNKTYSPRHSMVRSKTSSASFDLADVKTGNYYTGVHTLRCEDKFTNLNSGLESISTESMSMEANSHFPAYGQRSSRNRCTGFKPRQQYTTAFAKSDKIPSFVFERNKDISKSDVVRCRDTKFPVKCRRTFLNGKYRKMLATKQRRRSKTSHIVSCASKKT